MANVLYAIKPTGPFPVHSSINYIIDLPYKEWEKVANVKLSDVSIFDNRNQRLLKDGDLLRLPNGSWLEVTVEGDAFGGEGRLFGVLERLAWSEDIENDITTKREEGLVYKTCATYIR